MSPKFKRSFEVNRKGSLMLCYCTDCQTISGAPDEAGDPRLWLLT